MYIEFFGLRESPFNSTLSPRFFFASPQHEEALASLVYAARQRKGLAVVTGEVGSGKTLVTRMMVERLGDGVDASIVNTTHLTGTALLESLCRDLQVPIDPGFNTMDILSALEEHLLLQASRDRLAVLIVDDAHALEDKHFEQLRLVSNMETADGKLLQIVLAGQPDLNGLLQRLSSRQLQQRIFRTFHIDRLSRDQVAEYIRFRLQMAGLTGPELFGEQAIDVIHQYANGIPRLINNLCDNVLLSAFSEGVRVVDRQRVNQVIDEMMSDPTAGRTPGPHGSPDDLDSAITDITRQYAHSLEHQVAELEATAADTDRRIHELHRLSAKLQAQQLKFNEQQPVLDARMRELHRLSVNLQHQHDSLLQREKTMARQAEEVLKLSERLDAQDRKLTEREASLKEQHREIERLSASLAEQDARLTERAGFIDRKLTERQVSFDRELNDCKRAINRKWKEIREIVAQYEARENAQGKRLLAVHQRLEQFAGIEGQLASREASLEKVLDESRRLLAGAEQSVAHLQQLIDNAGIIMDKPVEILARVERQSTQVERMARIVHQAGEGLHQTVGESLECSKRISTEGRELCQRLEQIQDQALSSVKDLEVRAARTHELREILRQIFVEAEGQVSQLKTAVTHAEQVMCKLPAQLEQLRENAVHPTRLVRELRDVGSATERNLHDGQVRLAELRQMVDKAEKARRSIEALILASRRVAENRRPVPFLDRDSDSAAVDPSRPHDVLASRIESLTEAVRSARSRSTLDLNLPGAAPGTVEESGPMQQA